MNETCDRCGPAINAAYRVDRAGEPIAALLRLRVTRGARGTDDVVICGRRLCRRGCWRWVRQAGRIGPSVFGSVDPL